MHRPDNPIPEPNMEKPIEKMELFLKFKDTLAENLQDNYMEKMCQQCSGQRNQNRKIKSLTWQRLSTSLSIG